MGTRIGTETFICNKCDHENTSMFYEVSAYAKSVGIDCEDCDYTQTIKFGN